MFESQCPICMRVYIEPVLLPCDHCVCKPCFDEIVKKANLQCPLCRRRIGSWARLRARNGTLVDAERWRYMQKHHSTAVKARLSGSSTPIRSSGSEMREQCSIVLAQTGEIRKEYERELRKIQQERAEQDHASENLIKEILAQDEKELAAFRVADKENKPAAAALSSRLSLPRRSSSVDSITGEFSRHFKPIVRYPRTPPRPSDKERGYPETIKVTPCPQTVKRLDFASSVTPPDTTTGMCSTTTDETVSQDPQPSASRTQAARAKDHTFLLPLQTIVDDQSNDGQPLVSSSSSSASTSVSTTSRLRIETTSPIILTMSPAGTYGSPRSGAATTISYRSDTSSPDYKRLKTNGSVGRRQPKMNGHLKSKSSKSVAAAAATAAVSNGANAATHVCNGVSSGTPVSNGANGHIPGSPRRVTRSRATSSTTTRAGSKRSNSSRPSSRRSSTTLHCHSVLSSTTGDLDNDDSIVANGGLAEPAFVDPDEGYARNLQKIFDMERKYNLTALRAPGSGNEYFTRRRSQTNTTRRQ